MAPSFGTGPAASPVGAPAGTRGRARHGRHLAGRVVRRRLVRRRTAPTTAARVPRGPHSRADRPSRAPPPGGSRTVVLWGQTRTWAGCGLLALPGRPGQRAVPPAGASASRLVVETATTALLGRRQHGSRRAHVRDRHLVECPWC
ncbi:hypothetical protein QJS66_01940 [Kocuria rhizophila]|nr:hypothetical protein QJS66_01940 [Kocuria rhizophila]